MMIGYGRQYIDNDDIKAVTKVLKSNLITQGSNVKKFEKSLSKTFGSKYSSALSSGTAALHLLGLALGWKKGDIVLTTPISFLATSNSILYSGAKPEFVDIDKNDFNISIKLLLKKILKLKKEKKKIVAIICTDFAGHPCDWKNLRFLGNKYNVKLVNDNCHALGAKYFGDKGYAVRYADVVSQSFQSLKNITTGEGGAIITNDKKIHNKVKILRSHGVVSKSRKGFHWKNNQIDLGYNYRLTDFQSALGISQLKKINIFMRRRTEIASIYDTCFSENKNLSIPKTNLRNEHAYHLYPLLIDFNKLKIKKDKMLNFFLKKGIRLQVNYTPLYHYDFYKKNFNYKKKLFPNAENFFQQEVSIPIFPGLSKNDQLKFIKLFNNYLFN